MVRCSSQNGKRIHSILSLLVCLPFALLFLVLVLFCLGWHSVACSCLLLLPAACRFLPVLAFASFCYFPVGLFLFISASFCFFLLLSASLLLFLKKPSKRQNGLPYVFQSVYLQPLTARMEILTSLHSASIPAPIFIFSHFAAGCQ